MAEIPSSIAALDAAANHLLSAEASIEIAMQKGVSVALDDGPYWRLVLNTIRSARQFVADSRDALRAAEPHVFDGPGLGLEGDR